MRRRTTLPILALLALLAAAAAPAQEEIYKWVDENGVTHFGERPPAGAEARRVDVQPVPAVTPPPPAPEPPATPESQDAAPGGEPELSYAEQRRQERAEARAEALREQQVREENCKRMRAQVAALEPNPRVIVNDEDGNPRRLSDEERLSALEEAKKYIAENCEGR